MIRALGMYEESLERFVSAQELDERARDFSALIEAQYAMHLAELDALAVTPGCLIQGNTKDATTNPRDVA
jgi:hypothetical protein